MCEHYKYMLQLKPEFDYKFIHTRKHSPMIYLCEVRDVAKGKVKLDYDKTHYNLLVKECGKCPICRYKRASVKAMQCQCEVKHLKNKASFVTLTFGNDQMTEYIKNDSRFNDMSDYKKKKYINYLQWTLEKKEFVLFMKRLRWKCFQEDLLTFSLAKGYTKNYLTKSGRERKKIIMDKSYDYSDFKPRKIRYMHCGEYGELKCRPHHHLILLGLDLSFDKSIVRYSWKKKKNIVVHFNNWLSDLWQFGDATTDKVNYQACNYVARYITKKTVNYNKQLSDKDISGTIYNGRLPEYCTQSNRFGIGYDYYMANAKKINSDLQLPFTNNKGQVKYVPIPRYFKELMYRHYRSDFEKMQKLSIEKQKQFTDTPASLLFNRELSDRDKHEQIYSKFIGNFEKNCKSKNAIDYEIFELKKKVFDDVVYFKDLCLSDYSDTDFVDTSENVRLTCFRNFEKYKRLLRKKALFEYIENRRKYPFVHNLVLSYQAKKFSIDIIKNPFYSDNFRKLPVKTIESWRLYDNE